MLENLLHCVDNCTEPTQGDGLTEPPNIFPTLMQLFLTVKLGWLAGYYKIISPEQARGLGIFVGKFSLPVLIFVSLATLDFTHVEWSFLTAIAISKIGIFVVVCLADYALEKDLSQAAMFALFCTMQNDFAIGAPILEAIYGGTNEYVGLLYLVAPISLLILEPAAFLMIEVTRNSSGETKTLRDQMKTFLAVMRSLSMNPILVMTILGVLSNLAFKGSLPESLLKFLRPLGASFSSLAPFTLGLNVVGKSKSFHCTDVKPIIVLVLIKSLLTPIISYILVDQMSRVFHGFANPEITNFGFLYGTFPTALGISTYSSQFNICPDLISAGILIVHAFSAPLVYVSASILKILNTTQDMYLESLRLFEFDICILSIIGLILISLIFIISKRFLLMPHTLTFSVIFFSLQTATGSLLWAVFHDHALWTRYLQVILYFHGLYSCYLSTGLLSFSLFLISSGYSKQVEERLKTLLIMAGPCLAAASVTILATTQNLPEENSKDLLLGYGHLQDLVTILVSGVSLCLTIACLVLRHRLEVQLSEDHDEEDPLLQPTTLCDQAAYSVSGRLSHNPQMFHHTLLLLLSCCSMFTTLSMSIMRMTGMWDTNISFPGVYKVLVFMDTFLCSGHGLIFLAVFAWDCRFVLIPAQQLVRRVARMVKGVEMNIPAWGLFGDDQDDARPERSNYTAL